MNDRIERLEAAVRTIDERNKRVEADKSWEVSIIRRLTILAVTYIVAVFVFWTIDAAVPLIQALIPTVGYLLSTLSLGIMKQRWQSSSEPPASSPE